MGGEPTVFSADFDKRSTESLAQSAAALVVILTTFSGIALARVATHRVRGDGKRFLVEFALIAGPGVVSVTVGNEYNALFVAVTILLLAAFVYRTRSLLQARHRCDFDLGARPTILTLVRALTHLITAICILAIDFASFHRPFRKSRQYGAQLMDTGIGLFVLTMGVVSRRPRHRADVRRTLMWSVGPLLLLGLGRTTVIMAIGYSQDEHEYGQHLNAFFTLGLTKLCGTALSAGLRSDLQLLWLGLGLLTAHQFGLSCGLANYIMDDDVPRSTPFSANREGLLSLPGFVAIYLMSIYFTRWLLSKTLLSYAEMVQKLWSLLYVMLACWSLFVLSAYGFGISRVSCNFGYAVWMFAIITTMLWLAMFVGDFIVNTVLPLPSANAAGSLEQGVPLLPTSAPATASKSGFLICEALNMNGLTFFMLANVLTGCVNIFLSPEDRSDGASVCILLAYMLLSTAAACLLYKKRVRIA